MIADSCIMCGIAGFVDIKNNVADLEALGTQFNALLKHRGPDHAGLWSKREEGLLLCHTRLSILDLSPSGHQPMQSAKLRYIISYNGEIYNSPTLREELKAEGHAFQGHSDTEVLLTGIEAWGLENTLQKLNGMFAFALYDTLKQTLSLVRDRIGIKPLYYGYSTQGDFIFGSELKVLSHYPKFDQAINLEALGVFFRHNYIPAPLCIYTNAYKLAPGECLSLNLRNKPFRPVTKAYWKAEDHWLNADKQTSDSTDENELEELLEDAVTIRMLSDVPLGTFLSGGIDSSLVTALIQKSSPQAAKTFSIGFEDPAYNEAPFAQAIAKHLGTDHTEFYVTEKDALEVVPKLANIWDEPFSDSSQIPTFLVSQLAREHVTTILSGDGGDELFAGYPRYFETLRYWDKLNALPQRLANPLLRRCGKLPSSLDASLDLIRKVVQPLRPYTPGTSGPALRRIAEMLSAKSFSEFYGYTNSHKTPPGGLLSNGSDVIAPLFSTQHEPSKDLLNFMCYLDLKTYLPADILTKVDRASMAVSLETRVPLLDYRIVEWAGKQHSSTKSSAANPKSLLKNIAYRHIPAPLLDRPKKGFGVPLKSWLRGPLSPWADELIYDELQYKHPHLDGPKIQKLWEDFKGGRTQQAATLWNVLMYLAWSRETKQEGLL